ncbi:Membrane protein involved in the export of O-antigen and teichoic acid [Bizionia echini]|uniref:Membrane protein involved in the export of O-antigen and teichoic acid n=1 Tax=Bizionia echini TaxID=649333 RepID=A0A1I4Z8M5_9FLAO|nr:flippase [Bizionia echini]SFN46644.1 Membrane protein involved in the export of O-antigen and teichoic acid [Bizionia echini]
MLKKLKNIINDTDIKEILNKGFSFLIFRLGGVLAGYFFTYFIARHYGASVNGLVSLSFSLFLFISIFGCFGIDTNLVRFFSDKVNLENNQGIFYRVLVKSTLLSCVLAFTLYLSRNFFAEFLFNKPQLEPYIKWIALTIPFWVITLICGGMLRAKRQNSWFAFLNNPGRFLFSLLAIVCLSFYFSDPIISIKSHFYGVFFLAILSLIVATRNLDKITFKTSESSWIFLKESFPMMLSSTILVLLGWLDTFMLGIYESDDVIGVYNVALKIAALTVFSLQAINSILAPKLAESYAINDEVNFKKIINFSAKINLVLTVFTVLTIIVFHRFLLGIFGEEFLSGSVVLLIFCFGQLLNALSGSVGVILQMTGNQKKYQNIVLIALFLNLVLNFILTPIYGAIGAATATVISISSWNIMGAVYLKRKLNITSYFTIN